MEREYLQKGYKNLGCVNINRKAYEAFQKSTDKQEFKIGRCEYLVVCHDLRVFATIDSGD